MTTVVTVTATAAAVTVTTAAMAAVGGMSVVVHSSRLSPLWAPRGACRVMEEEKPVIPRRRNRLSRDEASTTRSPPYCLIPHTLCFVPVSLAVTSPPSLRSSWRRTSGTINPLRLSSSQPVVPPKGTAGLYHSLSVHQRLADMVALLVQRRRGACSSFLPLLVVLLLLMSSGFRWLSTWPPSAFYSKSQQSSLWWRCHTHSSPRDSHFDSSPCVVTRLSHSVQGYPEATVLGKSCHASVLIISFRRWRDLFYWTGVWCKLAEGMCARVKLNHYFHPSKSSPRSVRADFSILDRYQICDHARQRNTWHAERTGYEKRYY